MTIAATDDWDDHFVPQALSCRPDLAIQLVLGKFARDDSKSYSILDKLPPLAKFDQLLLGRMLVSPKLAPLVPQIFSEAFESFPESELRRVILSPHIDQDQLRWRLGSSSNPLHRNIHSDLVNSVLSGKPDLHRYRDVANMLRTYSRDGLFSILQPLFDNNSDRSLMFVRELEMVRGERLVNEEGRFLR